MKEDSKNIKDDTLATRDVPQNIEAEQALLGALLTNPRALEKVGDFLLAEHFYLPEHKKIYSACLDLIERGRTADVRTLNDYFKSNGALDDVGGASYLLKLASTSATIINVAEYGRIIFDRYLRRELIDIGYTIVNDAHEIKLDKDVLDQIGVAEKSLFEIANSGLREGGLRPFAEPLARAVKEVETARLSPDGVSGISTGINSVDLKLTGLHPSDLMILAGRPGMGKTALATCIAYNVAKDFAHANAKPGAEKKSVAFFSLEMSSAQLAARILATETQINSEAMRSGKVNEEDFSRLLACMTEMNNLPLMIDDTPALSVSGIRTRARRLKRDKEKGLGLIVIDYLQLIATTDIKNPENRVQALSEITRGLKQLAKELDVPVLVLSQLSRQVESRDDKRPLLSDLRESGSIEQDADIVLFVFREFYYLKKDEKEKPENKHLETKAELIVAKQRHGSVGTVNLYFNGRYTQFGDLYEQEVPSF